MQVSSASLHQAATPPSTPQITHLEPGELAYQLRLVPPIIPREGGRKPKPFFAACAATQCGGPTEKLVFLAYAAISGPTGATWAVKGKRVHFYGRQAKVATITGCAARTVYTMTLRLLQAGRLLRVLSGRGRIPHVFVVVPDGWYSQSRPARRSDLNPVDRQDDPINRAFVPPPIFPKMRGGYSDIEPETGPDAPPLVAVASPPPSESARKQPVNSSYSPPLIGLANKAEAQPHIEAMRAIARPSSRMRPSSDPLPEPTPERRAAALATFEAFDAAMDLEQEISRLPKKGVGLSLDSPSLNRGGVRNADTTG